MNVLLSVLENVSVSQLIYGFDDDGRSIIPLIPLTFLHNPSESLPSVTWLGFYAHSLRTLVCVVCTPLPPVLLVEFLLLDVDRGFHLPLSIFPHNDRRSPV